MAILSTKARNKLPKKDFALEGERKYPVDTKARAANAKARSSQQYNKGALSATKKAKIFSRANKVLGK